jgi:hypothetical protein
VGLHLQGPALHPRPARGLLGHGRHAAHPAAPDTARGGRTILDLEARRERFRRIQEARDQGFTDEQIGSALDPPISRQRVQRIRTRGLPGPVGYPLGRPRPPRNLEKRLALWHTILEAHAKGLSDEQIGASLDPPLSRKRVQRIRSRGVTSRRTVRQQQEGT